MTSIPIVTANIHTDYGDEPAVVTFRLQSSDELTLYFPGEGMPVLYFEVKAKNRSSPRSAAAFRAAFPLRVAIIPTLGPLEADEDVADIDYVDRWKSSHRAPRLFRNNWFYNSEAFGDFKALVESTWAGMSIDSPQRVDYASKKLSMFCREGNIDREIFWAGNGFQIWLQLLTHILRAKDADILVVDEPEIYLHPDLQRRIVGVLGDSHTQVVLATHSVEIINEVPPDDVIMVHKGARAAQRIQDDSQLQTAIGLLGSSQNVQLTRLARARRVLFVEGQDRKILAGLLLAAGFPKVLDGGVVTIPLGGFTQWERVEHADWVFSNVLGERLKIAALFDRDYRCDDEVNDFVRRMLKRTDCTHVHDRKEIENYLLVPAVLARAITAELKRRGRKEVVSAQDAHELLLLLTDPLKSNVLGQLIASSVLFTRSRGGSADLATLSQRVSQQLDIDWGSDARLRLVPGKDVLSAVGAAAQSKWGCSVSTAGILRVLTRADLPDSFVAFAEALNRFAVG